ncbi:TPA: nucleotidyltransferase domain-containing protein [Streptococcus agalactiae]|uniref:Nucleotidyltransferase domain-containing protein n=1 Tax=Streptococcus porcinus TaxID=1340 RepID=A0A7V9WSD8_STRPO|nr:nucleotidyltransferase domain-containing protein [Streptococcus porcinus]HEN0128855.1 nucleotidyltransferase domain-containing protein [Streptococcus agalactiae]MBA2796227.1 nucleotidyltransferase domain-containing protein [Streptococcus porcinus]HEN0586082.1 nucleotidyltransferase domain-containing protein [Streptococcus agalactiae]HEN0669335.1 nucleotidyltransferase domain-containing protein [Streptococcus agalactiae]HEN0679257.1 nucleotidyltransferase domain-containing protein [Streptoco
MVYTIEEIKEKIQPIAEKYELPVVYLFGSYARQEADDESDIDIAVSVQGLDITGFELLDLEDEIKNVFSRPVDFLVVEDIEVGKSPIAIQVKKNFQKEKVKLYETGSVRKRLLLS